MKQKYFSYTSLLLIVILTGFQLTEDPRFLENLRGSLRLYNATYPEEKVYVHFDKPFYKPGEDIWFNVFVVNSNTHKPTNISDVVYVELIDPKGNVAFKSELPIQEGTARGDFFLNEHVPGGIYKARAFTQWMRNFNAGTDGHQNSFTKEIQVQRVITPRLLLKLAFDKEAHGPGAKVSATLSVRNLRNENVQDATVSISAKVTGNTIWSSTQSTNAEGELKINFALPDTLNSADGLLTATVRHAGGEESIARSIPIVLNKITLQILPEGGSWMYGVKSSIAFKALNEFGKGADVSGVIVDDAENVVAQFESYHMGMGAFELLPVTGKRYYARIESPVRLPKILLPDPLTGGFVMNASDATDTTVAWTIHATQKTIAYLVGHSHGEMIYGEPLNLNAGENRITHSTSKFPAGIGVFTLFNASGVEQCERLMFFNRHKGLRIEINTDKEKYLPREPVTINIKTLDNHGNPVPAKLSLSVVDDQLISFADDKQDNILSAFLMSSELKGEIQEPAFYFDPDEPKAAKALDFLLMTQGWRRFNWKQVQANNRTMLFPAEKNRQLSGLLTNMRGAPVSGEVTLLEIGGNRRILTVKTTEDGYFQFKNVDPTISNMLLSKNPAQITLQKNGSFRVSLNDKEGTELLPAIPGDELTSRDRVEIARQSLAPGDDAGLDMGMSSDVAQLSEVVVVGYGAEEKRALVGTITAVRTDDIGWLQLTNTLSALQGRMPGLLIQPQTGNASAQTIISMRGMSSLTNGHQEPLIVVDGHPIGASLNRNIPNGSMIGSEYISSIEVMNSPEATALYGPDAANGVILVSTRTSLGYHHFSSSKRPPKYASVMVTPRNFTATREFYVPPPTISSDTRKDFRTTIHWSHSIVTNKDGNASVSFYNSDAVSAFRMTAEGMSSSGLIGRTEKVFATELPLSLDVKLPQFLGYEDVLRLPVRVRNETTSTLSGKVILTLPDELRVNETPAQFVRVQPKTTETVWYTVTSAAIEGEFPISVRLESEAQVDEMKHTIIVRPIGFPVRMSFSAQEVDKVVRFNIRDAEQNSIKAEISAFPDVLSDLFTGAESILREPHGCFEQVSSSNFPNVLALQFLQESGTINPGTEMRALKLLRDGYTRLTAYEINDGGFEWFGHPPAHEGLTAYGLIQFHEMKKVAGLVDEKMMKRTRDWLLSRRDGKGGFRQHKGKYGFSGAAEEVTNAYVLYALSESGTKDIMPEYFEAYNEVMKSNDMYRMPLVAITAFNLDRTDDYNTLVNTFRKHVDRTGFDLKADHSIVQSYGNSLRTEIISLWAVALMKSKSADLPLVRSCIQEILASRSYGGFGSTQGTSMALMALTRFAGMSRTTRDDGEIQVYLGDHVVETMAYKKDATGKLTLNKFGNELTKNGEQTLRIRFNETREPLPYSVEIAWNTKTPPSSDACQVKLSTTMSANIVSLNESVRLTTVLENKSAEGLPMAVAVIGIPAGLSAQPWQLKELQEKQVFDFYEIIGGNLVVYYRELAPRAKQTIHLDLKAEIPGSYVGAASSAYLYYTNEFRHWIPGSVVEVVSNQ